MQPSAPGGGEIRRGYAICATQRSGSNYLCQLLSSTDLLGRPLDYFNPAGRRAKGWLMYPDEPEAQLDLIRAHGSTPNGIYGFKTFTEHLDRLTAAGWTGRLPGLQWIYLRRSDLLDQAISLIIAKQTARWRSNALAYDAPRYDARAIAEEIAAIARDDARWRLYFANHGLRPLELSYEALVVDPQAAAEAVASLMSLKGPVTIDPTRCDVAVQRNEVNRDWRARFLTERVAVPSVAIARRPRLTLSIVTKDSHERLPRLLAEAREYADEVIVGVDASSEDGTLDVAASGADIVYRFRLAQPGQLAPARLLPFDYATGDWILSLDDDESMEATFDALAPELMRAGGATHYYFPRKWIVSEDPPEYVHAPPWFPNWAPRMFRNDRSLVWKPPQAHSMYQVQGPGHYDARTCIVHFEPVWCSPERRRAKLDGYRNAGALMHSEEYYTIGEDALRRPVQLRPLRAGAPRRWAGAVHAEIREPAVRQFPPWGATFLDVDVPEVAAPGETLVARVTLRNTGAMAWTQTYAQWPAAAWPLLRLGYLVYHLDGTPAAPHDGARIALAHFVAPGDEVTFIDHITAPETPGEYVFAWDMVSEGYCWFSQCGSAVHRRRLSVRHARSSPTPERGALSATVRL